MYTGAINKTTDVVCLTKMQGPHRQAEVRHPNISKKKAPLHAELKLIGCAP